MLPLFIGTCVFYCVKWLREFVFGYVVVEGVGGIIEICVGRWKCWSIIVMGRWVDLESFK